AARDVARLEPVGVEESGGLLGAAAGAAHHVDRLIVTEFGQLGHPGGQVAQRDVSRGRRVTGAPLVVLADVEQRELAVGQVSHPGGRYVFGKHWHGADGATTAVGLASIGPVPVLTRREPDAFLGLPVPRYVLVPPEAVRGGRVPSPHAVRHAGSVSL